MPATMEEIFTAVVVAVAGVIFAAVAGGALMMAWLYGAFLAQWVGLVDDAESLLWCGHVFTC